jgi:hypothetical protein
MIASDTHILENQGDSLHLGTESKTLACKTSFVLILALLPWTIVALFTAGLSGALVLVAYGVLAFLAGFAVVSAILPPQDRACAIVLAPAAGVLTLSALTAFWLRLGLPLPWVPLIWLGLAAVGTIAVLRGREQLRSSRLDYGIPLIAVSVLICAIYFLPGALSDAVLRSDGSFSWFNIDTQLYNSMVVSIRDSVSPPKMAGTATAELRYHFGPYAVAAGISLLTRIAEGDALVRVTRGVEQWALIFSCFGLGTILSLKANGRAFGALMSVVGLFFYGSVLSLFSGVVNPHPVAAWPMLFEAGGQFPSNGGPFSHLLLGISMLHGLEAVTAIMGLCLAQRAAESISSWRILPVIILPAFVITVHSVAGLYCLAVVAILLFWDHLATPRSWIFIALMLGLFLGAWKVMDYRHAPVGAGAGVQFSHLASNWWSFVMWFSVALGIRIIAFGWLTKTLKHPLAMLVLASFAGLLSFSWLGALWIGLEHYGVYYLQAVFSILAFSRLPWEFWRIKARKKWVAEWLSHARTGLLLFTISGALIGAAGYAIHRNAGINHFRGRMVLCVLFLGLLMIVLRTWKSSERFSTIASAVTVAVLLVGFLAWIPPWLKYRTAGQSYNVTLTPGEVHGLARLEKMAARGERFATNKHFPTGGTDEHTADSYAYGTLSGLPVLLEGSYDGAEENLPGFATLNHDNDLLFNTTDPASLRRVAQTYDIHWLVLRPHTDLSLPTPLPAWLTEQHDTGDLRIYRVN